MEATRWPVWRAALRHQLLLTFRDRRTLLLVVALSLLFGAVGANTLVQQVGGHAAAPPVRELAVSLTQLPGETAVFLRQAGLTLVDTPDPEGLVARGGVALGLVMEPVPGASGQTSARFVAHPGSGLAPAGGGGLNGPQRQPQPEEVITLLLTMLVVVPAIGATGAAAELGAGEKERKTLEPMLMTPLPPFVLAGAKLAAVLSASLLAAGLATVVQLGLLLWLDWQQALPFTVEPLSALVPILLLCVTVAVLISGPALVISLIARTMREATLAMLPLNLAAVGLAYLVVRLPMAGLSDGIWYAPGVNALLLVRLALAGVPIEIGQAAVVAVTTILLGLALTGIAALQLKREAVL